jgi:hypothetical protein
MRFPLPILLLALVLGRPSAARAQLNNWDPTWYATDSALVFHDDLDYYLNAYSKKEIKSMRRQVNIWRMNWDRMMRQTIREIRAYSEGRGMEPRTHDFTLTDAETGAPYSLLAHNGQVRAFMLGSVTNPPARVQMDRWSRLVAKYAQEDVQLFVVYGRELHPGDRKHYKHFPPPATMEEKTAHARAFAELGKLPVLVDGMDDAVFDLYGRAPNGAYIIDKDGTLVFRGTWADDRKVEHIIDSLLKWYKAGKPKGFGQ